MLFIASATVFLWMLQKKSDDEIEPRTPDAIVTAFIDDIIADSIKANVQMDAKPHFPFLLKETRIYLR